MYLTQKQNENKTKENQTTTCLQLNEGESGQLAGREAL